MSQLPLLCVELKCRLSLSSEGTMQCLCSLQLQTHRSTNARTQCLPNSRIHTPIHLPLVTAPPESSHLQLAPKPRYRVSVLPHPQPPGSCLDNKSKPQASSSKIRTRKLKKSQGFVIEAAVSQTYQPGFEGEVVFPQPCRGATWGRWMQRMQATLMCEVSGLNTGPKRRAGLVRRCPEFLQAVVSRPSSPSESASSFDLLSFIFPRALELLPARTLVGILESGSTKW